MARSHSKEFKPTVQVIEEEVEDLDQLQREQEEEESPERKRLVHNLKLSYFNHTEIFNKQMKIGSPEHIDMLSLHEARNATVMLNSMLYATSNRLLLSSVLGLVNKGVGKLFNVPSEKLDSNEELKNSFVNSPIAHMLLNYVPAPALPALRYGVAIMKLKLEQREKFPPSIGAVDQEQQNNNVVVQEQQNFAGERPNNLATP